MNYSRILSEDLEMDNLGLKGRGINFLWITQHGQRYYWCMFPREDGPY